MRRLAAGLLLVPALILTGCSSSPKAKSADAATPAPSASAAPTPMPVPTAVDSTANLPTVTGAFGSTPTVTLPTGKPNGAFVVHEVSTGKGAKVSATDLTIINIQVLDWNTGKTISTAYAKDSAPLLRDPSKGSLPALTSSVVGHAEGSRVIAVAPPAAGAGQMNPTSLTQLKIAATDTLVFVVDITKRVGPKDDVAGTQTASPAGMPTVDATFGAVSKFTIAAADRKPAKLLTAALIKGTGPKVQAGQTIVVQYTGATLADGKVFDSSWKSGGSAFSTVIGQQAVIPGWDQGLVGQTVGSRVLLSIPSALAYGAQGQGGIPANADLVFVVDILAAA